MVTVREACEIDCDTILEWRNHPLVRLHSSKSEKINAIDHEVWFSNALKSKAILLYIGLSDVDGIGVVSFYLNNSDSCVVNIYLNPVYIGRGYGGELLLMGLKKLKKAKPSVNEVNATILPENTASIRMFERQGFKKIEEGKYTLCLTS